MRDLRACETIVVRDYSAGMVTELFIRSREAQHTLRDVTYSARSRA